MTDVEIDEFIKNSGGLEFPNVPFRKDSEAKYTTPFGIDTSTNQLFPIRLHLGTDRGKGRWGQVYAPFDGIARIEESADYGTLVRIIVQDEFEVRIGHMNLDEIEIPQKNVVQGQYIGRAGKAGRSTGIHTHTEIVSLSGESSLCELILNAKHLNSRFFTPAELRRQAGELWPQLQDDMARKGVSDVSPVKIRKLDSWTGRVQTYYDSRSLFGI